MSTLPRALRAEVTKVFTVRLWWVLGIILFCYVALIAAGAGALFGVEGDFPKEAIPPLVYSFATSVGYVIPLLFGAIATTIEFRHKLLTPTFLATPKRGRVLLAKLIVVTGVGALLGLIALLAAVGVGAGVMALSGTDPLLGDPNTWALIGRSVLAMALWCAIGVGLGALIPSQVAVIVIVLAFTQLVEPILRAAASIAEWSGEIARFLPGAASDALVGLSFFSLASFSANDETATNHSTLLVWWQGGLILFGIAAIACLLGYLTTWKRDVT